MFLCRLVDLWLVANLDRGSNEGSMLVYLGAPSSEA
jgi:hypothetical protein